MSNDAGMTKHYLNGKIQAVAVSGFQGTVLELVQTIAAFDPEAARIATCSNWRPSTDGKDWFYTHAWDAWLDEQLDQALM